MSSPLLGLDIGLKRTGVALSESGLIARPLTVLEATPPHMDAPLREIRQLVVEHGIRTVVAGVPYTSDDSATGQSLKVEALLSRLESELAQLPEPPELVRVNEFHSSRDAKREYPDAPLDSAAAAVILQSYLDETSA